MLYEQKDTEWLIKVLKGNASAIKYHQGLIEEIAETIMIIKNNNEQIKEELEKRKEYQELKTDQDLISILKDILIGQL